jgi:hypothetical protein
VGYISGFSQLTYLLELSLNNLLIRILLSVLSRNVEIKICDTVIVNGS